MVYSLAADAVMLVHFAFVLFVMLGGIAAWRWPRMAWLHLPALAWGVLVTVMRWVCPLTPLEQRLREAAGQASYEGGFIAHYIEPLVYPQELPWSIKLFLAALLLAFNVALYWHAWYRLRHEL